MSRRLTLVIPTLSRGGAERTIARLANHWAAQGNDVTLLTLDNGRNDAYPLDERVSRVALDALGDSRGTAAALGNNLQRLRRLRAALRASRPNAVVSFIDTTNVAVLLASIGLRTPVIVAERTDPRRHKIGRAWSLLRRIAYRRCAALVVQTEGVKAAIRSWAGSRPVCVIPNAAPNWGDCNAEAADREPIVIGMGRLLPGKGFDLLIDAFAKIASRHNDWKLRIVGEGPQRGELEELVRRRNLSERIELCGAVENPRAELCRASLFVLSSKFEGFPNVLLEAMACGAACIAFDCDSGPREIIRHDVDGLLVPPQDTEALAAALDQLISNREHRQRLAKSAVEVKQRFSEADFFRRWEDVLAAALLR